MVSAGFSKPYGKDAYFASSVGGAPLEVLTNMSETKTSCPKGRGFKPDFVIGFNTNLTT